MHFGSRNSTLTLNHARVYRFSPSHVRLLVFIAIICVFNKLLHSGWFAFLHPSYCTFKALRQRPLNEQEVEKWASYWTVAGILVAFEYTAEWLLNW